MLETDPDDGELLAQIPKYGLMVETHVFRRQSAPGVWEIELRDYLVQEQTHTGLFVLTLDQLPQLLPVFRDAAKLPRITRRIGR